jgi:hypothetical protein
VWAILVGLQDVRRVADFEPRNRVGHRGEERRRERAPEESAGESLRKESKLDPTELQKEVQRLNTEGKMPTLEELLEGIGEVRNEYRVKNLAAQAKKGK